jgi:hypothetical protein
MVEISSVIKGEKPPMNNFVQEDVLFERHSGTRDQIQAELIGIAKGLFENYETLDLIKIDPEYDHHARSTVVEGVRATVMKFFAKGLTMEKVKDFYANFEAH